MPSWRLGYPPSANNLYFTGRDGRRHLSARGRVYRDEVLLIVRQSGAVAPAGPLALTLWLTPPDRRRRDWDGAVKLLQDSICLELGFDDVRISEGHVYRLPPRKPGSVLARLRTVEQYRATEQMPLALGEREG